MEIALASPNQSGTKMGDIGKCATSHCKSVNLTVTDVGSPC